MARKKKYSPDEVGGKQFNDGPTAVEREQNSSYVAPPTFSHRHTTKIRLGKFTPEIFKRGGKLDAEA